MTRWVMNKVHCQFQHWPTAELEMEVSKFVKHNNSEFLAPLDHEGTLMNFYDREDWHAKLAWDMLRHMTIQDLELALQFTIQTDVAQTAVKKSIAQMKRLDKETPGTALEFSMIQGMRNEHNEHIVVREQSVMGEFNPVIIEFGDKCRRLEDKTPMKTINICKENSTTWT